MNRLIVTSAVLLASLIVAAGMRAAPPAHSAAGQKIIWLSDLRTAHKMAVAQNKPILIVFGAEWCGFCKKLEAQTLNTPEMVHYINQTFIPVHLDLDKEQKVGEILEVESLPCTIVLSPNADLLGRIDGYHKPEPFHQKLAAARQHYTPVAQTAGNSGATVR